MEKERWSTDHIPDGYPGRCDIELIKTVVQDLTDEHYRKTREGKNNVIWERQIAALIKAGRDELVQRRGLPGQPSPKPNDILLNVDGRRYWLNNNSNKFERAKVDAGEDAAPEALLAHYDKHGGFIQDEKYNKVTNGVFWVEYNNKQKTRNKWKRYFSVVKELSAHPVMSALILVGLVAGVLYAFGLDLRPFL